MPEGVNSLGTPQCLQAYPSLSVALSYSLPLSVTPHLIRSAPFPFWPYRPTLRLCIHSFIFSPASLSTVCLQTPCETGLDRADKRLIRDSMAHCTVTSSAWDDKLSLMLR